MGLAQAHPIKTLAMCMYVCVIEVRCLGGGARVVMHDLCTYFTLYCMCTITSTTIREQQLY